MFLFFRGNAYCDKRKCKQKKNPGEMCEFHYQCQSSICLESQKESLAQEGINQDFGYGCVLKFDNLQYNTLGRWVDGMIDQASDVPSNKNKNKEF